MSYRGALAKVRHRQQHGLCYYCDGEIDWRGDGSHIEHKTPKARGGSDEPENLALACPSCNLLKATLTEDEFMSSMIVEGSQAKMILPEGSYPRVPGEARNAPRCCHSVFDFDSGGIFSAYCSICLPIYSEVWERLETMRAPVSRAPLLRIKNFVRAIAGLGPRDDKKEKRRKNGHFFAEVQARGI